MQTFCQPFSSQKSDCDPNKLESDFIAGIATQRRTLKVISPKDVRIRGIGMLDDSVMTSSSVLRGRSDTTIAYVAPRPVDR